VQIAEQDVQAVDAAGVLGDQVVATLGEQTQDRGVVLELDAVEAPVVLSYRSDRDSVGDIGLPGVAGSQEACACGQLGRDVEDGLPGGDELGGEAATSPVAPSTAHWRSGHCVAHASSAAGVFLSTTSRIGGCDRLVGSTATAVRGLL
jgi:hypothetical protein